MLELDNFAYDYGLNVQLKQKIEDNFKVELGDKNLRVINWSRRWHVATISIICVLAPPIATTLRSSTLRLRLLTRDTAAAG